MEDFTGICIVGFLVLGVYKCFELSVRKKERLTYIDKFFAHCENKNISGTFEMPQILFEKQNQSSSWALKIALLLIGVGTGCLLSFLTIFYLDYMKVNAHHDIGPVLTFSCIFIFGGLGLLTSYLIEAKQSKKKE
ncbi:MAG: hypothetical protein LBS43_11220 [Prevotellaceae bacterium]|jgi:hypothetical protein|nr:hypothetical protein [Prevotellaceae bacterium]